MSDKEVEMQTTYTHDEKGQRVDVHRPSAINPGDYEYKTVGETRKHPVDGGPGGVCHHCGKAIRWEVHFKHLPSGKVVTFGEICTHILEMSDNRIDHEMVLLKRRAANEKKAWLAAKEKEGRAETFQRENPKIFRFLNEIEDNEKFDFLVDMKRSLERWGSLTERQVAAVERTMKAREDYIQKVLDAPVVEKPTENLSMGRCEIEGEILSHKWYESQYGSQHKMRVQLDSGHVVFGSVPRELSDWAYHNAEHQNRELKGVRVSFVATVEPKQGTTDFAYFKRPTKAQVI